MQATHQTLEVQLEEVDHRLGSASLEAVSGAPGPGVFRFVAHVLSDGYDVCGRPFAMPRHDVEADDRPAGTARHALARLCELDEQLQASGWRKRSELGQHWWSLRYTRE
jgi:hypothetical protein